MQTGICGSELNANAIMEIVNWYLQHGRTDPKRPYPVFPDMFCETSFMGSVTVSLSFSLSLSLPSFGRICPVNDVSPEEENEGSFRYMCFL